MFAQHIRQVAAHVGGFIFGAITIAAVIVAIRYVTPAPQPQAAPVTQYGPETGPPPSAPTLDYEAMVGLDPQTQQTNRERVRHNDLEWRVDKLEAEVRSLNQIVRGIREVRIGESGPIAEASEGEEE